MNKKVGIIILNYNTYDETEKCVTSIKKNTSLDYHIYIVDNMSKDDSYERLRREYSDDEKISIIQSLRNGGYSAGNNIGIRRAISEGSNIVFIINSDVELLNDALAIMTETLLSNDTYMMVGPSVMNNKQEETQMPKKKLTYSVFVMARHPFCNIPFLARKTNRLYDLPKKKSMAFEGSTSGCCFGMRACDFERINYFDENVFLYSEEDILAYKMSAIKKLAVVDLDAKVWHKENISTKKEGNAFVQYHRWSSALYMLKAYAGISKSKQIFIAIWNVLTWVILSAISLPHRKLLRDFYKKNWEIVKTNYENSITSATKFQKESR